MASGKVENKVTMAEEEKPAINVEKAEKEQKEEDEGESSEEELGLLEKPIEILETRRERKKVERLSLENEAKTPKKEELDYSKGRGVKLGDIEIVRYELDRTLASELKPLHKLLFKRGGKASMIKKNIRSFCGFPFEKDTKQYADLEWAMEKFTNVGLQRLCEIFGLDLKGKRDDLKKKVLEFLMEPFQTNKKVPVKDNKQKQKKAKKRKSESSGENSSKKKKSKETVEGDVEEDDQESEEEDEEEGKEEKKKKDSEKSKKKESKAKVKKSKATVIKLPTPSKKRKEKEEKPKKSKSPKKAKKEETEDSSDDEPLAKKTKTDEPTDDDLKAVVTELLDGADLETVTMKMICKQVFDRFPGQDLTERKSFIKETVKQIIS